MCAALIISLDRLWAEHRAHWSFHGSPGHKLCLTYLWEMSVFNGNPSNPLQGFQVRGDAGPPLSSRSSLCPLRVPGPLCRFYDKSSSRPLDIFAFAWLCDCDKVFLRDSSVILNWKEIPVDSLRAEKGYKTECFQRAWIHIFLDPTGTQTTRLHNHQAVGVYLAFLKNGCFRISRGHLGPLVCPTRVQPWRCSTCRNQTL